MNAIEYCPAVWTKKARSFVTRSHRHLWGKNNEDPQAFLFQQGLKNSFVKEMVMGWNKFTQERPAINWGAKTNAASETKLHLGEGIVVPYIIEKELKSVFIHPLNPAKTSKTTLLPGSLNSTMVLGTNKKQVVFLQNIFDGLFLYQEKKERGCVIIQPDTSIPVDDISRSILRAADQVFICSLAPSQKKPSQQIFSQIPDECFFSYTSKENLLDIV